MDKAVRALVATASALAIAGTAACGSGSDAPAEPTIDLATLDVGNLPTQPKYFDRVTGPEQARLVESWRVGDAMPLPQEIIPEARYAPSAMGGAIRNFIDFSSAAMKSRVSADPAAMNEAAKGFVTGFVTTGRNDRMGSLAYELDNVALLFTDEQAATEAAGALGRLDLAAGTGKEPVQVPGHPAAVAYTTDDVSGPGQLRSWYATGKFVVFTYVYDSVMSVLKERNLPALLERAQRSLDAIAPRLAAFEPTPADKMLELTPDRDGMLARSLSTVVADQAKRGIPGVYDRRGGLQISGDPDTDPTLFDEAGVDRVAWRGDFVYRARDFAGATRIVDARAETTRRFVPAESPKNLPNAKCRRYIAASKYDIGYYCYVAHDRYAAEVAANQLLDAQQRISAQYALLVNTH
ncbi:DUF7373 family lipoprotein [Nocardia jejuensis]|uniref:DUF7373 family lipoprotein n=1 Tax=Nocardia jejuensis TaxID=328049 RepID=UPI00082C56A3|nr:hypothetical protein [Nocardia jejuensis]